MTESCKKWNQNLESQNSQWLKNFPLATESNKSKKCSEAGLLYHNFILKEILNLKANNLTFAVLEVNESERK